MAGAMRDLGLSPDVVLVSSARRTLQTLEAISPFADSPLVEPMDDLYLAPWPRLIDTLRRVPETARSVMLIGHNPGLEDLLLYLAPASEAQRDKDKLLTTATLARLNLPGHAWKLKRDIATLRHFIRPRDLRD